MKDNTKSLIFPFLPIFSETIVSRTMSRTKGSNMEDPKVQFTIPFGSLLKVQGIEKSFLDMTGAEPRYIKMVTSG